MPLKITLNRVADVDESHPCDNLDNVSLGGIAFKSPRALRLGQNVSVSFPLLDESVSLGGKVVWNKKTDKGFLIGLEFEDPQALYQCRMIEQICHIQHYRQQVEQQEGRILSREQAANEWIHRYAQDFPPLKPRRDA